MMRESVAKAVHLVNAEHVTVDLWRLDNDGIIGTAAGHVESGDNTYWVQVTPTDMSCTCKHGTSRPGRDHSHTMALRLAAQMEATE